MNEHLTHGLLIRFCSMLTAVYFDNLELLGLGETILGVVRQKRIQLMAQQRACHYSYSLLCWRVGFYWVVQT